MGTDKIKEALEQLGFYDDTEGNSMAPLANAAMHQLTALVAALKPFAEQASALQSRPDNYGLVVRIGDCRAARKALEET